MFNGFGPSSFPYNARGMRLTLYALAIVLIVVVISVIVDMQNPNDFGGGNGCHANWFGVIPIGGYCGMP